MADERAVIIMLQPERLRFLNELRHKIAKDPNYLSTHSSEVSPKVQKILSNGGVHWHQDIFDREWREIVKEAISRIS